MSTLAVPPVIDYTKRQYADVRDELTAFVAATRPADYSDFFESNLGTAIVELNAYVADLISFGQDVVAQEIYLSTARRYDSALRFARSVGFVPRSAVAATAILRSTTLPSSVVTNGGVVSAGSFVEGLNGFFYEVETDAAIPPGSSIASIPVKEGRTFTETFTPTKAASQTFQVSQGIVEEDSWQVFVGDATDIGNLWTQVDNVLFESTDTQTYEVFFDGEGRVSVRFGDGNAGQVPNQLVTIIYRTTNGLNGNTALNTIRGNFTVSVLLGAITESLEVANTSAAASGGQDRETVEELRTNIPIFLRTLDKVVSIRDYDEAVTTQPGIALSFSDVPLASFSGNIVRVHVWDQEQIDFLVTSSSGVTSSVKYNQYAASTGIRKNQIQQYLQPRSMVTVHNIVVAPSVALVDLSIGIVTYDRINNRNTVHEDLVRAATDLFEDSSGFEIRIADIYSKLLLVPGVRYFTIQEIVFEHIDPLNPPTTIIETFSNDPAANPGTLPLQDLVILGAVNRVFYDDAFLYVNEILYNANIEDTSIQAINLRSLNFTLQA